MILNEELLEYAVMGGAILGGGGGGSREMGLRAGKAALMYNTPELIDINDIDINTTVFTASAVGAPAAKESSATPRDYVRAAQLLENTLGTKLSAVITNENGGTATINGWIQSAVMEIPLLDAPCNGRAHPTGAMGSIGLQKLDNYVSYQAAAGGAKDKGKYTELVVSGKLSNCAGLVRRAADMAGGLVAVARNPVSVSYVRDNGAIGGIKHAIETGKAFYEGLGTNPLKAVESAASFLNGQIVAEGRVGKFKLETINAFDVGFVTVDGFDMTFWNEYMTIEKNGERLFTFPDLIMTFDKITGYPVTTAEIKEGLEIYILVSAQHNLRLGAGMRDSALLKEVEPIIGKKII